MSSFFSLLRAAPRKSTLFPYTTLFRSKQKAPMPIEPALANVGGEPHATHMGGWGLLYVLGRDRKSTRLNSSHSQTSYAVFCLKKKKPEDVRGALQTAFDHDGPALVDIV